MSCSLEWKNQSLVLVQALNALRLNDTLVDVTLAAEGKSVKVHRLVLCACSPYFRELLGEQHHKEAIVYMKDISYNHLQLIVDYIYQGSIDIEHKDLKAFVQAANSLQIVGLIRDTPSEIDDLDDHDQVASPDITYDDDESEQVLPFSMLQLHTSSKKSKKRSSSSTQPSRKFPKIEDPLDCQDDIAEHSKQAEYLQLDLDPEANEDRQSPDDDDDPHHFISDGRYEFMEGKRKGSNLIADTQDGYVYRIRRYCSGKRYYRCCRDKCPGRLVGQDSGFSCLKEHDHPGDKHIVANYKLVAACRNRAVAEDTPVDQIIKEEVEKATGVSKILVTNRYLWKARQYHRRQLLQRLECTLGESESSQQFS